MGSHSYAVCPSFCGYWWLTAHTCITLWPPAILRTLSGSYNPTAPLEGQPTCSGWCRHMRPPGPWRGLSAALVTPWPPWGQAEASPPLKPHPHSALLLPCMSKSPSLSFPETLSSIIPPFIGSASRELNLRKGHSKFQKQVHYSNFYFGKQTKHL